MPFCVIGAATGESRVYEKVTEPSVIQGLANTQVISVQVRRGGARTVKTIDCYPPRCLDPKVSPTPLPPLAG